MNKKLLTISIAAYNVEKFIEFTLDSLLLPDEYMDKLDIIVVDDGSKDTTSTIVSRYVDKYPNSIRLVSKANGGYGSTINTSYPIAKGKYYKLLDGDDWYYTKNLCEYLDFLDKCDSDLVLTPYYEVYESDMHHTLIDRHGYINNIVTGIGDVNKIDFIGMHEITINTKLLKDKQPYILERCFYTDIEYNYNCLIVTKNICRYDKAIYCYRIGLEGQSISLTGIRKHYNDMVLVSSKLLKQFSGNETISGNWRALVESLIVKIIHDTYKAFLLLENPKKYRNQLIGYDRVMKEEYPDFYELTMKIKKISLLRSLNFKFYNIISKSVLLMFKSRN